MKKYLITALFFVFVSSIYAQSKSAELYIDKANLEWLETASADFNTLVNTIEVANEDKNYNASSKSKGDLIMSAYKAVSTSQNLHNLIKPAVNPEDGQSYEPMTKETDDKNVNLVFSEEEAASLKENTDLLLEIKTKLKSNDFDIHPGSEHTDKNIVLLKQFSEVFSNISASYLKAKNRS